MPKPRLLIPISLQFAVRYLVRTGLLRRIKDFADPVFLLGWEDPELRAELGALGEVHALTKAKWGQQYARARDYMSIWHRERFASPSSEIKERRTNLDRGVGTRIKRQAWLSFRKTVIRLPGRSAALRRSEELLFWTDTNAAEVRRQIATLRPDAAFCLTPYLADEELVVRVCALEGVPVCASILSFDNLTTRSWIPIIFDLYMLWNRHNAAQLRRGYPEASGRTVEIVGSPQFDFYRDTSYVWDESEWRRRLGLAKGRPVILFGGGHYSCAPHEPQFLQQLDEAIEAGELDPNAVILFRRHPVDPITRWEPVLCTAKHIVRDEPWQLGGKAMGHANIRRQDIEKLASTLQHSLVHVNVASTMTIDGAIFDRPQVGPAYDDSPGRKYDRTARECYLQEHYLPITTSGGVSIVNSREQLVQEVRAGLEDRARARDGRQRLIREICTYDDGKCTQRVSEALKRFVGREYKSSSAERKTALAL